MIDDLHYGDPASVNMSAERLSIAREVARRWVASGETTGLVVLFSRRGVVFWEEAFGVLTPAPNAPAMTPAALFPLASVSKPFIAAALMCVVEDGLVGLNRPVTAYLPEFIGDGKRAVTPLHLLTHTSGIDDALLTSPAADSPAVDGISQWITASCGVPLGFCPGAKWSYSTFGYILLATIIERVTGQDFPTFLRERLFHPLGMKNSSLRFASAPPERQARRYWPEPPVDGYAALLEAGRPEDVYSVASTAWDTALFANLFLRRGKANGHRVLAPATVDAMMRNHVTGLGLQFDDETVPTVSWGLGWHIRGDGVCRREASLGSPRTIDHQGNGGAHLWIDPEAEVVGVVLSLLRQGAAGFYPGWRSDLLANAVIAAIEE